MFPGSAALFPSPGHREARFGRQYFSYFAPFFAFFSHCGTWCQARLLYLFGYATLTTHSPLYTKTKSTIFTNILTDRRRTYSLQRTSRKMVRYLQQYTNDNLQKTDTYRQITKPIIVQLDLSQDYNYTDFDETSAIISLRLA